jgi:sugar (pentulose or hexulose) kinase
MIGTELLDWLASLLGLADAAAVVALAATSTRADLPVILPYLSPAGERSPFLDPAVRGTITGLDVGHTAADLARAAVDGLSLVVRDCLQAAGGAGRLAVCGGGAASELWCRTLADATGLPVARPATAEVGALGAVISGAVDAGLCPDLDRAVAAAVRDAQEFAPSVDGVSRLAAQWDRFVEVRGAMR